IKALNLVCRDFSHVGAASGLCWKLLRLNVNAIRPFRIALTLYPHGPRTATILPPKCPPNMALRLAVSHSATLETRIGVSDRCALRILTWPLRSIRPERAISRARLHSVRRTEARSDSIGR